MKFLTILSLFLLQFALLEAKAGHTAYAGLLKKYVKAEGVDYAAWQTNAEDLDALDSLLVIWAEVDVKTLSDSEQKAFYINLYNAAMLQAVFKNYPLKSVKNIGLIPFSIFKKNFIEQGDRRLSLDDVEKGILLKEHFDPRIHFAVNCASGSCPSLRAEPYCASKLDAQLDEQTRLFAESDRAARLNVKQQRYAYSELFNWYDNDFEGEHPAEYLNLYRGEPLPIDEKFDWIPYDWSLNASN